jgi:hypothetical protein
LEKTGVSDFMGGVVDLLDRSVAAEGYVIREASEGDGDGLVNLGEIQLRGAPGAVREGA